ncbi:MAG: YihY/virulence factor BrkB family protein [Microthrixaceae bacterium]
MADVDVHPTSAQHPGLLGVLVGVQERFRDIRGQNAASALTLSLFLSIFPLILVAVSVLGFVSAGDPEFIDNTIDNLNLTGDAQEIFTNAVDSAQRNRGTVGLIGLITGAWSGLGVTTALQVAANVPWQVAGRGIKDKAVGVLFLLGAVVLFVGSGVASWAIGLLPGWASVLGSLLPFAVSVLLFGWMYWMLCRWKLTVRQVLPGAVVAAIGLEALKLLAIYWLPGVIAKSQGVYGSIGVVFGIFAWLLIFGKVVVYASVLNVVLEERRSGTVDMLVRVPRLADRAGQARTNRGGLVDQDSKPMKVPGLKPKPDPTNGVTARITKGDTADV